MSPAATGHLQDRFPYVSAGSGPRTLLVLPGLEDSMFSGRYPPGTEWLFRAYVSRFLDDYTVYLVSRPRGLPADASIDDVAADYATLLAETLGPADVVGISMGGMIAQVLGARRPDLVDRLVLANTGTRIADREAVDRFRRYARDRNWAGIRARLATAMFADWRANAYPLLVRTVGRPFQPRPADPTDVEASIDAVAAFDSRDWLADVGPPTLVFGGTRDPYFPPRITRETADEIPGAELELVRGGKHAAYHEFKWQFDDAVGRFFDSAVSRFPATAPPPSRTAPPVQGREPPEAGTTGSGVPRRESTPGPSN